MEKHLYKFLLNYRTTPHSTTGFAPSELLFNRKVRDKLLQLTSEHTNQSDLGAKVKGNDDRAKVKMMMYADTKARTKTSTIKVGDIVLARQRKDNKLSTCFDLIPFQVVHLNGTMFTAHRNGKYITHNVSYFKVIDTEIQGDDDNEEEEEDNLVSSLNSKSSTLNANVNPPQKELRRSTRNRSLYYGWIFSLSINILSKTINSSIIIDELIVLDKMFMDSEKIHP